MNHVYVTVVELSGFRDFDGQCILLRDTAFRWLR